MSRSASPTTATSPSLGLRAPRRSGACVPFMAVSSAAGQSLAVWDRPGSERRQRSVPSSAVGRLTKNAERRGPSHGAWPITGRTPWCSARTDEYRKQDGRSAKAKATLPADVASRETRVRGWPGDEFLLDKSVLVPPTQHCSREQESLVCLVLCIQHLGAEGTNVGQYL